MMVEFHGTKIALVCGSELLVYRRDQRSDIPFPGKWDLPGGGREGTETPEQCVLRELHEEFSIRLANDRLHYRRDYLVPNRRAKSCFFGASVYPSETSSIEFGKEGQYWRLLDIEEYLCHKDGIPTLQAHLRDYMGHAS